MFLHGVSFQVNIYEFFVWDWWKVFENILDINPNSNSLVNWSTKIDPLKCPSKYLNSISPLFFFFNNYKRPALLYRSPFPSHKWGRPQEISSLDKPFKKWIFFYQNFYFVLGLDHQGYFSKHFVILLD